MPFYDSWLENRLIYGLAQVIFAPGHKSMLGVIFRATFPDSRGWVLDLGCGPRPVTPEPRGVLVGLDVNPGYLKAYTGGFLDDDPSRVGRKPIPKRRMGFQVRAEKLPFRPAVFDEIRSTSFFHHLDDASVRKTLFEMDRCLKPGGRIVVFDAVWPNPKYSRPLAWLTFALDRGRYIRTEESFRHLLEGTEGGAWTFDRVTYTYTGMEYLRGVFRKGRRRKLGRRP